MWKKIKEKRKRIYCGEDIFVGFGLSFKWIVLSWFFVFSFLKYVCDVKLFGKSKEV